VLLILVMQDKNFNFSLSRMCLKSCGNLTGRHWWKHENKHAVTSEIHLTIRCNNTVTSNVATITEVWSASARLLVCGAPGECYYNPIMLRRLFFISECTITCFLCAIRVFEVRASSASPRLPLCQIPFLWWPPLLS